MLIRPQLLTIIILILLNPFLYLYILIPELANFFLKKNHTENKAAANLERRMLRRRRRRLGGGGVRIRVRVSGAGGCSPLGPASSAI